MTTDQSDGGGGVGDSATPDGGVTASATTRTDGAVAGDEVGLFADSTLLALATREYRLTVRSRWELGIALLFGLFTGAVVQFGATAVGPGRFNAVVATLAELGVYLVPLAALAMGYDAVVGAEETGSLELLLSLPITRRRFVLGTFLGRAAVLSGAILLGFVPGAVLTLSYLGLGSLGTYAIVALAAAMTAVAVLGIGVLVSTAAAEKTHALGLALAIWLWLALLHDLVAIGAVSSLDLGGSAIAAAILSNPVDCFRVLALSQVDTIAGGFGSLLLQTGLSGRLVLGALLGWTVVPVALAGRLLDRRRL